MLFFETYTETWAEILNVIIYSFINTNNFENFYKMFVKYMDYERRFSLLQSIKILDYMGITYSDIVEKNEEAFLKRLTI